MERRDPPALVDQREGLRRRIASSRAGGFELGITRLDVTETPPPVGITLRSHDPGRAERKPSRARHMPKPRLVHLHSGSLPLEPRERQRSIPLAVTLTQSASKQNLAA